MLSTALIIARSLDSQLASTRHRPRPALILPASRHLLQDRQQRLDYPRPTRPVNTQIPNNPMQLHSIHARVIDEQKHEQTSQRLVIEQLASSPRQLVHSQSVAGLMSAVRAQNDLGLIEAPETAPQAVQVARVTGRSAAVQVGVV